MVNILKFLFNLYFEIKYRILYYFTKNVNNSIEIQNAYLINKNTKELEVIDNFNLNQISRDHILDIGFKWNKKDYRIQFLHNTNRIIFPYFSLNDIKTKVNNQIIMIYSLFLP